VIVYYQGLYYFFEEWMIRSTAHHVVTDAYRCCQRQPRRDGENAIKATVASLEKLNISNHIRGCGSTGEIYHVKIDVYASEMKQRKVPYSVGALDWISVCIPSFEKPWKFFGNKSSGFFVGPKLLEVSDHTARFGRLIFRDIGKHRPCIDSPDGDPCSSSLFPSICPGCCHLDRSGELS
jgi:hypothetical protein